jgi:hypothetical protein
MISAAITIYIFINKPNFELDALAVAIRKVKTIDVVRVICHLRP